MNTLLVGAMAGLIAGFLFAPQSGKRTREMFKERFSYYRNAPMYRESIDVQGKHKGGVEGRHERWATEKSLESTVHSDYLH